MASSDPTSSPLPLAPRKENSAPIGSKIAELSESRAELLNRLQSLKQDLQSWRMKVDTQVKVHRNELTELKKSLNVEVEQLRSEFQELRSTLTQQQEDVSASLKSLLQDRSLDSKAEEGAEDHHHVEREDRGLPAAIAEHTDDNTEDN